MKGGGDAVMEAPLSSSRTARERFSRLLISLTAQRCLLKLDCSSRRTMKVRCRGPTCKSNESGGLRTAQNAGGGGGF